MASCYPHLLGRLLSLKLLLPWLLPLPSRRSRCCSAAFLRPPNIAMNCSKQNVLCIDKRKEYDHVVCSCSRTGLLSAETACTFCFKPRIPKGPPFRPGKVLLGWGPFAYLSKRLRKWLPGLHLVTTVCPNKLHTENLSTSGSIMGQPEPEVTKIKKDITKHKL